MTEAGKVTVNPLSPDDQRKLVYACNRLPFSSEAMRAMPQLSRGVTVDDVVRVLDRVATLWDAHRQADNKRDLDMRQMSGLLHGARDFYAFLARVNPETGEPIAPADDLLA